jgi:hypothetical protein
MNMPFGGCTSIRRMRSDLDMSKWHNLQPLSGWWIDSWEEPEVTKSEQITRTQILNLIRKNVYAWEKKMIVMIWTLGNVLDKCSGFKKDMWRFQQLPLERLATIDVPNGIGAVFVIGNPNAAVATTWKDNYR